MQNVQKCQLFGVWLLYFIWNHHEIYIPIGTNMPSIGLVICEIGFEFNGFWENKTFFWMVKLMADEGDTQCSNGVSLDNLHIAWLYIE